MGRQLAKAVFELTARFPPEEKYGLTAQLRRSAVSVPSNIAEGWGRQSDGAFANALKITRGSLNEIETQLVLAEDFGYVDASQVDPLYQQIEALGRKLFNLTERLGGRYVKEEEASYGSSNP